MPKSAEEFSFGRNWSNFLRHSLQADQIEIAKAQTARFLGLTGLEGLTFIDIGCGSGIFSHAAHALGAAEVISFDVDPLSVRCCEHMREQAGCPENWRVFHGSVLDRDIISRLPPADIVYSWGVLHHTGAMWNAIRNAAGLVKPGGRFFISIYNRLEYDTMRQYRGSHGWLRLKRIYNRNPAIVKRAMECWFAAKDLAAFLVTLRNPFREIRRYRGKRGMSWWYDLVDWVGGYPYEFASSGEMFSFCHGELGLQLERLHSTSSLGCNEFLFLRPRDVETAAEHPAAGVFGRQEAGGAIS